MNDKELLEMAAKAADIGPVLCYESARNCLRIGDRDSYWLWRPLTDDGDALKLACALRFNIEINEDWVVVITCEPDASAEVPVNFDDVVTATRRAITLAAAEIGRITE